MNKRRLGFEQLEDRRVCALNVSLSSGGTLKITGDNSPDTVSITRSGFGLGEIVVNGTSLSGVKNISIDTKGGADSVTVDGVRIQGNLSVKTGAQIDTILLKASDLGPVEIQGKTTIHAGNEAGDKTSILGYASGYIGAGLSFGKATSIVSNHVDVQTGGNYSIDFNGGLSIKGISGAPPAVVNRVRLRGYAFGSGSVSNDVNVNGNLSISSKSSTAILLDDVNVSGKTTISLSKYLDSLVVIESTFQNKVSAKFGDSNDGLRITGSTFAANVSADGGKGSNLAELSSNTFALPPGVKNLTFGATVIPPNFPF